jgi:Ser/Thr protein kinase RdoA (MazF antagonist)/glycosyltransferase involved in cell wall biosynthesis
LYAFKQLVLTYQILDSIFALVKSSKLKPGQQEELIDMIQYFFYAALPDFIKGRELNPILHNVQALENMLRIVLVEKINDYEFIRKAAVLALLHDVGNSEVKGEKVSGGRLKELKAAVQNASDEGERKKRQAALDEALKNAISYRGSHMFSGKATVSDLIPAYNKYFGKTVFASSDVTEISEAVKIHDNPSNEAYQKDNTGKWNEKMLFKPDDELVKYLRDADRVWMLSPEGLEKDLIDEELADQKKYKEARQKGEKTKEPKKAKTPEEQLANNAQRHHDEYELYPNKFSADKLREYGFKEKTLYRTNAGYELFRAFKRSDRLRIYFLDPRDLKEDELIKILFAIKKSEDEIRQRLELLKTESPYFEGEKKLLDKDLELARKAYDKAQKKLAAKVKEKPMAIAFLGPSGSGKSTAIQYLLKTYPEMFTKLVRVTDRAERKKEGDKIHVSRDEFERMREQDEFLVTTHNYNFNYGVTRKVWADALASGKIILLDGLNTAKQILAKPELSKVVDLKIVGLFPADPNDEKGIWRNIGLRETKMATLNGKPVDPKAVHPRQAHGIAITRDARVMADEIIVNAPGVMELGEFYEKVERKVMAVFGQHNFIDIARQLEKIISKPGLRIPNGAKLVLRLGDPARKETSITPDMFNQVFEYLYEAGYVDEQFRMVSYDTTDFSEEKYHELLTAIKERIRFDNDVSIAALNVGEPFKGFYGNVRSESGEPLQSGASFLMRDGSSNFLDTLDEGKAFMAWFHGRYGRRSGYKVVLLGAGPTNTAIALEMAKTNVQKISIADKDIEVAKKPVGRLREMGVDAFAVSIDAENGTQGQTLHDKIAVADVVINGTGFGRNSELPGSPLIHNQKNMLEYKPGAVLVDLNYNLAENNFLSQGKEVNSTVETADGIGFLIEYNARQIISLMGIKPGSPLKDIVYKLVKKMTIGLLNQPLAPDYLPGEYLTALNEFGFPGEEIAGIAKMGGTRGTVYKITLKNGKKFIIKKEPAANQATIQAMVNLSNFYNEKKLPYPTFRKTLKGLSLVKIEDGVFTLQEVLPGEKADRGNLSNLELERVATKLAEMHRSGADYQPAQGEQFFKPGSDENFLQVDHYGEIMIAIRNLLEVIKGELNATDSDKKHPWRDKKKKKDFEDTLSNEEIIEKAMEYVEGNLKSGDYRDPKKFPNGFYVHGDFFQGNVLMKDSEVTGIIDLERARRATRWEDILTPMFDLNYHSHKDKLSFDFDRFALWLTSYQRVLKQERPDLALTEAERSTKHLRALLLIGYLQELHKGLQNRETWVKPGYVMAQVLNLQKILETGEDKFIDLSKYLREGWLWDQPVPESQPWLYDQLSNMSALGLQSNSINPEDSKNVVAWLARRVEKRQNIVISNDLIATLAQELSQEGLIDFANKGRSELRSKQQIYQEAQLLVNAIPSMSHQAAFNDIDVTLDAKELERMRQARARFANRYDELYKKARHYWEEELPGYRGAVEKFHDDERQKPDVTVIIVSVASRFESLLKRIHEMRTMRDSAKIEVNIVLADPDRYTTNQREQLRQAVGRLGVPVKLIDSQKNTISTNRNLGVLESRGDYTVFLDDDVRLVGPVIETLVNKLKQYPEIGVTQIVSYDHATGIHKPKLEYLKYAIDAETVLSGDVAGMILATRTEIVKVVPFIPFWPNFGEDGWFGKQVHGLGFFLSFLYPKDAYVIHEHVQTRLTNSPDTLKNVLTHDTLSFYLEPGSYDDMDDGKAIM